MARPSLSIFGNKYVLPKGISPTRNARNLDDIKLYKVEVDTKENFSLDSIITRIDYENVKKNYDIRLIKWTPGIIPGDTGRDLYYISGKKRNLVKNVASQYADQVHEQRDFIQIVGNKVRPYKIKEEAEMVGSFLWLNTMPESALGKKKVSEYKQLNRLK